MKSKLIANTQVTATPNILASPEFAFKKMEEII